MAKTILVKDTEANPQQTYDDPITIEEGSTSIVVTDPVSGAVASVDVRAPEDNGSAGLDLFATDALDGGAEIIVTATTEGGTADLLLKAEAGDGTATARLDAEAANVGTAVAALATTFGVTVVGIEATQDTNGGSLVIHDGNGETGDPGDVLAFSATVGSEWLPFDPLTSDGSIVLSADGGNNVVTLSDDGSFEVNGSGVVRLLGLPTADPVAAGQFWVDPAADFVVKQSQG